MQERMYLGWSSAGRVGGNWAGLVRVAYLIGAIQAVAVPLKIHTGATEIAVGAGDREQRESGGGFFYHIQLPVAQGRIDWATPGAAELFAFAKR